MSEGIYVLATIEGTLKNRGFGKRGTHGHGFFAIYVDGEITWHHEA